MSFVACFPRLFLRLAFYGAVALSTTEVQAQPVICGYGTGSLLLSACTSQSYDTVPTPTDKQITLISSNQDGLSKGPTSGDGLVIFGLDPMAPSPSWAVGFVNPTPAASSGTFLYSITITDPNYSFNSVSLEWSDSGTAGSPRSATMEFFTDATFTIPAPGYPVITSNSPTPTALPPGLTTLYVRDTYSAGQEVVLNNFTQRVVPGPFSLLGAGAAFGFSRRLRRRIRRDQELG